MIRVILLVLIGLSPLASRTAAEEPRRVVLDYAPAPVDNPLKGLVPYQGDRRETFPHSLEFNYLPVSAVVKNKGVYDWSPLEKMLDDIASRGHQAVLRFFLEYPGKKEGIPAYLLDAGLKVHVYTPEGSRDECRTPDYADPKLRAMLADFIAAWGKKYDGDPRIGFITAGLLGMWGEWHTYPREDLYASKNVEIEIMDAYEAAFKTTPVLLRYPAGENHYAHAPNAARNFGYHDDSFAWGTLDTGKKGDEWFYIPLLNAAGEKARTKWKTHPIGGEIRPEAWGLVFDPKPGRKEIQDFARCVAETRATWLLDSGMFERRQSPERIERASAEVRRMGYELHIPAVSVSRADGKIRLKIEVENRGVAPFYYDWPATLAVFAADGSVLASAKTNGRIKGLLPTDPARIWNEELDIAALKPGRYTVALQIPNPLKNGPPVRLANKSHDAPAKNWLTLTSISID